MKKILVLTATILLVIALVSGGTWAYFSATESIEGNTLQAGTLSLTFDGAYEAPIAISNVFPGDTGIADNWTIVNSATGNIEAGLGVTFTENGTSVLSNNMSVLLWIDKDNNDVLNPSDLVLKDDGNTANWTTLGGTPGANPLTDSTALGLYRSVTTLDGTTWGTKDIPIVRMMPGDTTNLFTVDYYFVDDGDQSSMMGLESKFDLAFTLYQTTATLP